LREEKSNLQPKGEKPKMIENGPKSPKQNLELPLGPQRLPDQKLPTNSKESTLRTRENIAKI
jgi:hypothetical protein